jgi:hypothetical protein
MTIQVAVLGGAATDYNGKLNLPGTFSSLPLAVKQLAQKPA